jgi:hypothetical protein
VLVGNRKKPIDFLRKAMELAAIKSEKKFLSKESARSMHPHEKAMNTKCGLA